MITALIFLLLIFWILGFGPFASIGPLIHVLLVVVLVLAVFQFMAGRGPRGDI